MNIRDIEARLGIPRASVRYYEKEGLLHPRRGSNNYRDYSQEDLETLQKIRLLRELDMPIETIRAVQAGEVPLSGALERQAALLESESSRLDHARAVCRAMAEDRVTYAELEPARYEGAALPGRAPSPGEAPIPARRPPVDGAEWAFDPWQRYWARTFDTALAGAVVWAALILGFRVSVAGMPRGVLQAVSLAMDWVLILLLEPLLLCTWGTTPGKWLLGLELRNKQGRKLSFLQGLRRTWGVLFTGYGLYIPVFSWYCLYKGYKECREDRPMSYDYEAENLYYSKVPQWGLRAAVSVALALLLIPVRTACSVQSLLPPNRGEVTPAEFAENVSEVSRILGRSLWVDEAGFRLSRSKKTAAIIIDIGAGENNWQERRYGERYEYSPAYTLELDGDGFVTGAVMEQEDSTPGEDAAWVSLPIEDARIIAMAFRGTQLGAREMTRGPVMEALERDPAEWTDQPVEEEDFTLTLTLEQEGYTSGAGCLIPEKRAKECWYRFSMVLRKNGDG